MGSFPETYNDPPAPWQESKGVGMKGDFTYISPLSLPFFAPVTQANLQKIYTTFSYLRGLLFNCLLTNERLINKVFFMKSAVQLGAPTLYLLEQDLEEHDEESTSLLEARSSRPKRDLLSVLCWEPGH